MLAGADLALASPGQGFCRSGGRVILLQWVGKEGGRSRIKAASHALAFVDWELRLRLKFGKSRSLSGTAFLFPGRVTLHKGEAP